MQVILEGQAPCPTIDHYCLQVSNSRLVHDPTQEVLHEPAFARPVHVVGFFDRVMVALHSFQNLLY